MFWHSFCCFLESEYVISYHVLTVDCFAINASYFITNVLQHTLIEMWETNMSPKCLYSNVSGALFISLVSRMCKVYSYKGSVLCVRILSMLRCLMLKTLIEKQAAYKTCWMVTLLRRGEGPQLYKGMKDDSGDLMETMGMERSRRFRV